MTKERRKDVMDIMFTTWKRLMDENPSVASNVGNTDHIDKTNAPSFEYPIVQSMDINTKSTSYARVAGASAKDQPKVNSNFRPLVADPVFNSVNISIPCKVVKKVSTHFEHTLYGYFIGKRVSFLVVEYFARDNWGKHRSSFTRCLIEVNSEVELVDVVTIGIPLLTGDNFTKKPIRVEYEWRPPRCDICKIFGHVHDHFPKKIVSPPIVSTSNVVTPTVKKTNNDFQTAAISAPKKRATNVSNASKSSSLLKTTCTSSKNDNITTSNSYSAFNDKEEDVENVYDKTSNLFPNTKTGGSSSFTATAG
nr:hypothetical protein [Tanacetum cinerariifolium]